MRMAARLPIRENGPPFFVSACIRFQLPAFGYASVGLPFIASQKSVTV